MSKKIAYFFIYLLIFLFGPCLVKAEAETLELVPPVTQQREYPLSAEGFKEILFDLYQFGTESHYTIELDGILDLGQTTVGADRSLSAPTLETINFASLSANLTFKGIGTEAKLVLPNTCFFGQDAHFETLNLQAAKIYGNGHKLLFDKIEHSQNTQLFGGGIGDLVGNPVISFQQVSGGSWEIFGGNEAGTLTGSPVIHISAMTGDITQLCGGSLKGEILGDVRTEIRSLNGSLLNYYGGGFGTEAEPVKVSGSITNQLCSQSSNFSIENFVGGVAFGRTGAIDTLINGVGGFTEDGILIGGSQTGEVYGQETAIRTTIDTRQFQKGERSFVGGNQYGGAIYGHIENQLFAGKASKGSFKRIDGAGGMDVQKKSLTPSQTVIPAINLTDPQERTAEELFYDRLTSSERFSIAKSKTAFLVEGNVTTRLMGGCVSRGVGNENNVCGAGYAGVINGEVRLTLGEEGLVYSKRWEESAQEKGNDPNFLTEDDNLGSYYGFSVAAGGGNSLSPWESILYINGKTELIVKQALLSYAYGGSFSGMIEGDCRLRLEGGQVSGLCGAGGGCYRIYGNSLLEMTGGVLERYAVAGSNYDRWMVGNARTEISGGKILGLLAASYGVRSNHRIEGDVETIVSGGRFAKSNEATQIMGGIAKNGLVSGNVSLKLTGSLELAAGIGISAARPRNAEVKNCLGGADKQVAFELTTEQPFTAVELLGDGAENPLSLYTPKIDLKIKAPNGSFSLIQGMIKNSYGTRLNHEVAIDVQAAQALETIIGSDLTTFNNRLIENSTVDVALKIGAEQDGIQVEKIANFTQLAIEKQVSAKAILNGSGATSENFEQSHHQFGDLTLAAGAQLAVEELKTGRLIVAENAELHSPPAAKSIFLRELVPEKRLIWRSLLSESLRAVQGKYFAQQKGYSVMTFAGGASALSPENFIGFDAAGSAFTGDSNNEVGLAVAAVIIDYQVTSPSGKITHNLPLKPENRPLPLTAWGTVNEKGGEMVLPVGNKLVPELTFIGTENSSFQQAEITAGNGEKEVVTENFWRPTENGYYQIKAQFEQANGTLQLLSVPEIIDFGRQAIGKKTTFYPKVIGQLEIADTRIEQEPWELTLQAEAPEDGYLYFQEFGKSFPLNEAAVLFKQTGSLTTTFDDWGETKGVYLTIPKERQRMGDHTMTFHWTLTTKVE
ncbi:hypothetical protein [Enterococcus sp. AZ196]|uniref:hypothetical protein n=1 Tax=Enterococcus sp. AZ196 TaxID=2774659 RepID=UPI003D29B2C9